MPNFAKAFTAANTDCGSRIGVNSELELLTEISQEALHAEALSGTMSDAMKLSFSTGKGDSRLSLRPVFDQALPDHGDSS